MNNMKMLEIMYINDQEPWMGVYNPKLPKGDDVHGDGTWNNPFKTAERALLELKQRGEQHGSVRNLQSQLIAFQDNYGSFEDCRKTALANAKKALDEAFNKHASNTDRGRVPETKTPK
jgi:hypothetical protein